MDRMMTERQIEEWLEKIDKDLEEAEHNQRIVLTRPAELLTLQVKKDVLRKVLKSLD